MRRAVPMYLWAALITCAGVILVLIAHRFVEPWETAFHEVGFAFIVSVIIWLIFEHQLSREAEHIWDTRIERVTTNVFQAVLRKDLPKGLLDEANNLVLNSSVVRKGFTVTYTLMDSTFTDLGKPYECVLVEAVMEFTMENVGTDTFRWSVNLGLPNPIHPNLKRKIGVRAMDVTKGGEPVHFDLESAQRHFREELDAGNAHTITFRAGVVEMQPGESCMFSATYMMAKEAEDSEFLKTLYPADSIRVTVFDKATDGRRVTFAKSVHRKPLESVCNGDGDNLSKIFKIPGYLLPHQGVLIWWKRRPADLTAEPPLPIESGDDTTSADPSGEIV